MATPLNGKTKIRWNAKNMDDVIELTHYYSRIANLHKLEEEAARAVLAAVRDEEPAPTTADKVENKKLKAAYVQVKAEWAAHKENKVKFDAKQEADKAKAKEDREKSKVEALEKKEGFSNALVQAKSSEAIVAIHSEVQAGMDEVLKGKLPECFIIKDGALKIRKGHIPTQEDYAAGFAATSQLVEAGDSFMDSIAKREAQMAKLALKQFGDDWVNYFGTDSKSVSRIKKYMKADDVANELGQQAVYNSIPLNNFRAISENKFVNGDKKKDDEEKVKLFEHIKAKLPLETATQAMIRKAVQEYKLSIGLDQKVTYTYVGVRTIDGKIKLRRFNEKSAAVVSAFSFVFDKQHNRLKVDAATGEVVLVAIEALTEEEKAAWTADYTAALAADEKKPTGKKVEPKAPANKAAAVVADDDDEPEADDDDEEESAPVKPVVKVAVGKAAKAPLKVVPAPVAEDEEEEEEEEVATEPEVDEDAEDEIQTEDDDDVETSDDEDEDDGDDD